VARIEALSDPGPFVQDKMSLSGKGADFQGVNEPKFRVSGHQRGWPQQG